MEAIRIRADQAEIGMVVASDVYTSSDQLVFLKGTILDKRMIIKLKIYNIFGLYIYPAGNEELKVESYLELVRSTREFKKFTHSYVDTLKETENNFNRMIQGWDKLDIEKMLESTEHILKEGRNGIHVFEMLQGIRDYDDMTFVHSLNVSIIASVFADWLKFSPQEKRELTLAGLFHDIGKLLVPQDILTKAEKLTKQEFDLIKKHTDRGYQVLKDYPIDIRVKLAALMHHERCDGSGYPNGFRSDQIEAFSKIIAIADVYDAMTSNRKYRDAICPFAVVAEFEKDGYLKFDPKYLMVFMERIVQSYMHTIVRLSDGREGEVMMINKLTMSRPVVRIGTEFVDLSREHHLSITAII